MDSQIAWEIGHTSGGATLAEVYGGVPPHWLAGNGPKLSWMPAGLKFENASALQVVSHPKPVYPDQTP